MEGLLLLRILISFTLLISSQSFAASSSTGFGVSVGSGIPYLGQVGANYKFSDKLNFYANYNILDLSAGSAKVKLAMPEVGVTFHPMSGAFFLGLAIGQEALDVSATDTATSQEVKAEVDAMTGIAKIGWMWGIANGGFWFGIDLAYVSPFSADTTVTAPGVPTTSQDYQDVVDAADKFGDSGYINFTFARLGYIF